MYERLWDLYIADKRCSAWVDAPRKPVSAYDKFYCNIFRSIYLSDWMRQMRFDCLLGRHRRHNLWIRDPQSCARWACHRGWQSSCFCSSHLFACRRAAVWSHSALLWCAVLPADDSRYWCWFHWLRLFCRRLGCLSERLANRRPHSLCTGQPTIQF